MEDEEDVEPCIPQYLYWTPVEEADKYQFQIDDDPAFNTPEMDQETTEPFFASPDFLPGLADSTTYNWRVRAWNQLGWGDWSDVGQFRATDAPIGNSSPDLLSPPNGAGNYPQPIELIWGDVAGASHYEVTVDDEPSFLSPEVQRYSATTSYSVSGLTESTTYNWRVLPRNNCGAGLHSEVWTFTPYCPPVSPAMLASPPDSATNISLPAQLSWFPISGAAKYQVQVDDGQDFSNPEINAEPTFLFHNAETLAAGTTYNWRVRGFNGCNWGDWSPMWQFTTCAPLVEVNLVTPNNSSYSEVTLTLSWNTDASVSAEKFLVQVDESPDFSSPEINIEQASPTLGVSNLTQGTTYNWRVRGFNGCDWGDWSPVWQFTTCAPLAAVALQSPADGALNVDSQVTLDWDDIGGAVKYQVQLDDDPDFTSPIFASREVTASDYSPNLYAYATGRTFYWRVRAYNGCQWEAWSSVYHFTMGYENPVLVNPDYGAADLTIPVTLEWRYVPPSHSVSCPPLGPYPVPDVLYELWIDDDPLLANPDKTQQSANTLVLSDLSPGTTYYWQVYARYCVPGSGFPIPGVDEVWTDPSPRWRFTTLCLCWTHPPYCPQLMLRQA
jgi:hypothetical protein